MPEPTPQPPPRTRCELHTADLEDDGGAATRELLVLFARAATATTTPAVTTAVAILAAGGRGEALRACLELQTLAPHDSTPLDRELYGAAISLAAALWHVQTGTDPTRALDAAQAHLHAALDAHTPPGGGAR